MISYSSITGKGALSRGKHARYCHNLTQLLFFWRALQARVSRQALLKAEEDDSDEEPKEPERISLAQLKQRGKKGVVPVVRTGNAIKSERWNANKLLMNF